MANPGQNSNKIFRPVHRATTILLGLTMVFGLTGGAQARAQTLTVLHTFGGGPNDGATPFAGVTVDVGGNLYGTTYYGGPTGQGTVYRLARKNGHWIFTPLHTFDGFGAGPKARVVIGPNGTLYGTTSTGEVLNCNGGQGCGVVFNLTPPPNIPPTPSTPWIFNLLYIFEGGYDGGMPQFGDVVFDSSGAIYGTTLEGGSINLGIVFKLTPSGRNYVESTLYSFSEGASGYYPYGSVVFDTAGNLYTTTSNGGANGLGNVVELTPSGGDWIETTIHAFPAQFVDGIFPMSGPTFDHAGNLYGTTYEGSPYSNGIVYELSPSSGSWTESLLHGFPVIPNRQPGGPQSPLVMDAAGNFYGMTTGEGTHGAGNVFQLTPSNGGWVYQNIYNFTGGSDGAFPYGNLAFDADGSLYGTTSAGGSSACNCGVVWEIQMP